MAKETSNEPPAAGMAYAARRCVQLLSDLNLNRGGSAKPVGTALTPQQERLRCIFVLVLLSKFIHEIGGTIEQSGYIDDLAWALADLDNGVVSPILKPTEYGRGKRADTSKVWRARAYVATGLEALIHTGMSRERAAKEALSELPYIERLMTERSKRQTTEKPDALVNVVLSWHDDLGRHRIGKGRSKNSAWIDTLKVGTAFLDGCAKDPRALKKLARIQFRQASRI